MAGISSLVKKIIVSICIFFRLHHHNVKALVVLDGSYETAKLKTRWRRTREKLQTASDCNPSTQDRKFVLPLLAKGNSADNPSPTVFLKKIYF